MLRRSGQGRIINFASLGGLLAWPLYALLRLEACNHADALPGAALAPELP